MVEETKDKGYTEGRKPKGRHETPTGTIIDLTPVFHGRVYLCPVLLTPPPVPLGHPVVEPET